MRIESKRKLKFKHYLYQVSLLAFILMVFWLGFEIYWSYSKEKPDVNIYADLTPLSPNLYSSLAKKISDTRTVIPDQELNNYKSGLLGIPISQTDLTASPESTQELATPDEETQIETETDQ